MKLEELINIVEDETYIEVCDNNGHKMLFWNADYLFTGDEDLKDKVRRMVGLDVEYMEIKQVQEKQVLSVLLNGNVEEET